MGTPLTIVVSDHHWRRLLLTIPEVVKITDMMRHASCIPEEDVIYLKMASRGWAYTRQDRGLGSPILSMSNGDNADSTSIPQMIKIIPANKTPDCTATPAYRRQYKKYQDLAHFLRTSIRLSAASIETFLELEAQEQCSRLEVNRLISRGNSLEEKSMLSTVCSALSYARKNGFFNTKNLRKMLRPSSLVALSRRFHISAADRYFDKCWTVMVKLEGTSATEALRKRAPSFFMYWPETAICKPQVHVVDTPVLRHRNCLLLAFEDEPGEREIDQVLNRLRTALYVDPNVSMLPTRAFQKGEDEDWIRADGFLEVDFHDKVLCRHLREAMERDMKAKPGKASKTYTVSERLPSDRPPQRFVIFARQGREDGDLARRTIPRQLTTILASGLFEGPSKIFRPGTDKLLLLEEVCSSNQHPWTDRRIFKDLPRDLPLLFLTVNPDRLTSRSAEVKLAIARGTWYDHALTCILQEVLANLLIGSPRVSSRRPEMSETGSRSKETL